MIFNGHKIMLAVNSNNCILKIKKIYESDTLRALTVGIEFPVIPGRIQMERFILVECFRKKVLKYFLFLALPELETIGYSEKSEPARLFPSCEWVLLIFHLYSTIHTYVYMCISFSHSFTGIPRNFCTICLHH